MICPNCKKETASIFRECQFCGTDLEQYRSNRNNAIEGTGDNAMGSSSIESILINFGPIGGIIMMVVAVLWFKTGLSYNKIYFYSPILFCVGVYGLVAGLKRSKKRRELKARKKKGELLD